MRDDELAAAQDTDRHAPPDGFDEEEMLARVGGNRTMLAGLIEVLYQDCNTQMAELGAALRAGDAPRVQAAAHTVKGMVTFFGAGSVADAARRLERAGESGEVTGAGGLFAELARELAALASVLSPYGPTPEEGWHS